MPSARDVAQIELIGQMKIDLDGGVSFFVAHHVGELDIQLGSIKRRFALASTIGQPESVHGLAQDALAQFPHGVVIDVFFFIRPIAAAKDGSGTG